MGSPCYLAPEIVLSLEEVNGTYGTQVDIWSLGITCIEMALKDPPRHDMEPMAILFDIVNTDSPKLISQTIQFSPELISFVDTCLQKDPQQRGTIKQLLNVMIFLLSFFFKKKKTKKFIH